VGSAQAWTPNYDESKAGNFTLPDPLVFNDGTPVKTAREWRQRRRAEILQLLETNVYGSTPKPPKHIRFKVFDVDKGALGGKAIRKQVTIYMPTPQAEVSEHLLIYIPADAPKPVPVILQLNFNGNQSVTSDPGVKAAALWIGDPPVRQPAPERLRGIDKEFNVEKVLARGYSFATIYYGDIEPDFKEGYKQGGLRQQFLQPGQTGRAPDDWGAIGAWAYGLSRAMDYLEKDKDVDAHRVAIMGHSRLGKTVLWAGAQDERFAVVLSSCSGRGGASPWRRNYGETIQSMSVAFTPWPFTSVKESTRLRPSIGTSSWLSLTCTCALIETVEFIHRNPVRRGRVKRPEDWKWSSVHKYVFPAVADGSGTKGEGQAGNEGVQLG
jgi:hypothetical protein